MSSLYSDLVQCNLLRIFCTFVRPVSFDSSCAWLTKLYYAILCIEYSNSKLVSNGELLNGNPFSNQISFIFNKYGRLFSHEKIQNLYSHAFQLYIDVVTNGIKVCSNCFLLYMMKVIRHVPVHKETVR